MKKQNEILKVLLQKLNYYREGLYLFLKHNVCRVKEGDRLNAPAIIVKLVLFPSTFLFLLDRMNPIKYDFCYDRFTIYGVRYSNEFFKAIRNLKIQEPLLFQIIRTDANEFITHRLGATNDLESKSKVELLKEIDLLKLERDSFESALNGKIQDEIVQMKRAEKILEDIEKEIKK